MYKTKKMLGGSMWNQYQSSFLTIQVGYSGFIEIEDRSRLEPPLLRIIANGSISILQPIGFLQISSRGSRFILPVTPK